MSGSRREFLRDTSALAAASVILGFDGLLGCTSAQEEPADAGLTAELRAALHLMKQRQHDGVVFRIPDTEAGRLQMAEGLLDLLDNFESSYANRGDLNWPERYDLALLFAEAVFACAPTEGMDFGEGHNVLLLDPDGKRLAGATVDFGDHRKTFEALRELLDRQPFANARQERLDQESVAAALDLVRDDQTAIFTSDRPEERVKVLHAAPALAPLARKASDGTLTRRMAMVVAAAYSGHAEKKDGETALFGVEWQYEYYDYCPTCGMMSVPAAARQFVRFLLEE